MRRAVQNVAVLAAAWLLAHPQAVYAEHFGFAWPLPASVGVRATVAKDDLVSTAHYRAVLGDAGNGELALDFEDFRLLELNGEDATRGDVAQRLAPLAALTSALPTMRLSRDGEYLGVRGLNRVLQQVLALLPPDTPPARRDQLARSLRSPRMQALLQQKSGEIWNVWVAAWNGLDLDAGQQLEAEVPLTLAGHALTQHVVVQHLGAAPDDPGYVRLRMTTTVEGPELRAWLGTFIGELSARGALEGAVTAASTRSVTEVITRAADLVPHHAFATTEVRVVDSGGHGFHQHERKEYWFEWP